MPTYVMICFRLPKSRTKQLTGPVAQFWWSSNDLQRGLHSVSWQKICRSKLEGGMRFQIVDDFNTALLAK